MSPQFAMVVCALTRPYSFAHWPRSSLLAPLAPLLVRPSGGSSAARWQVRAEPGTAKPSGSAKNGTRRQPAPRRSPRAIQQISEPNRGSSNQPFKRAPNMARAVLRRSAKPVDLAGRRLLSPRSSGVSEIPASSGDFRQPMQQAQRRKALTPASTRQKKRKKLPCRNNRL